MTVEHFRDRLERPQDHPNDRFWMPTGLAKYAAQQPNGGQRLGHQHVKTTMIDTHVMNRPGPAVTRPRDRMRGSAASA